MPKRYYLGRRGPIYYVRFRVSTPFGKDEILSAVSSGKKDEEAAKQWAEENHPNRVRPELALGDKVMFKDYTKGWYTPGHEWVTREEARREDKFAAGYLRGCRACLERHILPTFAKAPIGRITKRHIEDWLFSLRRRGKSTSTCNHALSALRQILSQAADDGIIKDNPAAKARSLRKREAKRGTLTSVEADALLEESAIKSLWRGSVAHFTISLLAANTGMRIGEIQALQLQHVHLEGKTKWVQVSHGWRHDEGLSKPKWGLEHPAPIDDKVAKWLGVMVSLSGCTEPEDLIFHGDPAEIAKVHPGADPKRLPMNERYVVTRYKAALEKLGVDAKTRRIVFHSWRHFWISELRRRNLPQHVIRYFAGLPPMRRQDPNPIAALHDRLVRYLTGHRSDATEAYTHISLDDLTPVSLIEELVAKTNFEAGEGPHKN